MRDCLVDCLQFGIIGLMFAIGFDINYWWIGFIVGFFGGLISINYMKFLRILSVVLYYVVLILALMVSSIVIICYPLAIIFHKPVLELMMPPSQSLAAIIIFHIFNGIFVCAVGTFIFFEQEVIDPTKIREIAKDPDNFPNNFDRARRLKKLSVYIRIMLLVPISVVGISLGIFILLRAIVKLAYYNFLSIFSKKLDY